MNAEQNDPVIIDLDDPTPRGAIVMGVIITFTILTLIISPFVVIFHPRMTSPPVEDNSARITTTRRPVCQPDVTVPGIIEPLTHLALPGFMRICDWLAPAAPPASQSLPGSRAWTRIDGYA